jgi:hypothetical protein
MQTSRVTISSTLKPSVEVAQQVAANKSKLSKRMMSIKNFLMYSTCTWAHRFFFISSVRNPRVWLGKFGAQKIGGH